MKTVAWLFVITTFVVGLGGCLSQTSNDVLYSKVVDWCDPQGTCSVGKKP